MGGINKVMIVGHVGKDPEVKSFNSGDKVASFSIATSQSWKDKQTGDRKERTEWHNISVRNQGTVGIVEKYVRKGSLVGVIGELQTRKWQDQNGNDRYSTEVVIAPFNGELFLLGAKSDGGSDRSERQDDRGGSSGGRSSRGGGGSSGGGSSGGGFGGGGLDDEVPF